MTKPSEHQTTAVFLAFLCMGSGDVIGPLTGLAKKHYELSDFSATLFQLLIGLSFTNIFPLIFSITIDDMPERTNELSGLMITIIGGAVLFSHHGKGGRSVQHHRELFCPVGSHPVHSVSFFLFSQSK